jgi:hypothetical protein
VSHSLATGKEIPHTSDEILQMLELAKAGDESVNEQVREMLTICPEFAESLGGDLGQITERLLSTAVAGNDIPFREAIKHKMATLRQDPQQPLLNRCSSTGLSFAGCKSKPPILLMQKRSLKP